MAWGREFRRCDVEEDVGTGRLQRHNLGVDRRFTRLVALFADNHGLRLGAKAILEAFHVVLSVIVVLIQDGDPPVRHLLQDIFRVNPALGLVAGLPSHRPREMLGIVPFRGAGGHEQLRYLFFVHVAVNGGIGGGSKRVEDQQDIVVFDQLARLFERLWRAICVVVGDEIDLAAVDAAFVVDHLEKCRLGLADRGVGGGRAAVRHDIADLDFAIGRSRTILLLIDGGSGDARGYDPQRA